MIPVLTFLCMLDQCPDLIYVILDKLPFKDLWNFSMTCRSLKNIILKNKRFQKGITLLNEIQESDIINQEDYKFITITKEKYTFIMDTPIMIKRFDQIKKFNSYSLV